MIKTATVAALAPAAPADSADAASLAACHARYACGCDDQDLIRVGLIKKSATVAIACAAMAPAVAACTIDDDTAHLKDLQRRGLASYGHRTVAAGLWVWDDLEHGDTPANAAEKIRQHNGPKAEMFVHNHPLALPPVRRPGPVARGRAGRNRGGWKELMKRWHCEMARRVLAVSWPDLLWPMTVSKGEVIAAAKASAHGALRHWRERRQL
jgi:hypothetical protein